MFGGRAFGLEEIQGGHLEPSELVLASGIVHGNHQANLSAFFSIIA
jgi:hypothetical protein